MRYTVGMVLDGKAVADVWCGTPHIDTDADPDTETVRVASLLRDMRNDHPEWAEVRGRNTRNDARAMVSYAHFMANPPRHDETYMRTLARHGIVPTANDETTEGIGMTQCGDCMGTGEAMAFPGAGNCPACNGTGATNGDPALQGVAAAVAAIPWESIAPERSGELDTSRNGEVLEAIGEILRDALPSGASLRVVCDASDYLAEGDRIMDAQGETIADDRMSAWHEIVGEAMQSATEAVGIVWDDPTVSLEDAEPHGMTRDAGDIVDTLYPGGYPACYTPMQPATDDGVFWETIGDVLCADCARDACASGLADDEAMLAADTSGFEYGAYSCNVCGCDLTGGDPEIPDNITYRYDGPIDPRDMTRYDGLDGIDAIVWRCDRDAMPSARDLWDAIADTPRREDVKVYAGIVTRNGRAHAERLQIVYWPGRCRIGIAWGADAQFADVGPELTSPATVCAMVDLYLNDGETFAAMS